MINTIKSYSSDNSELRRGRVVSGKPMDHTIRSNVGRHSLYQTNRQNFNEGMNESNQSNQSINGGKHHAHMKQQKANKQNEAFQSFYF